MVSTCNYLQIKKAMGEKTARLQVYIPEYHDYAYCYLDTRNNSMCYRTRDSCNVIVDGNLSCMYAFVCANKRHFMITYLCVLSLQLSGKSSQTTVHLLNIFPILSQMGPIIFQTNGEVRLRHTSRLKAQYTIMDLSI